MHELSRSNEDVKVKIEYELLLELTYTLTFATYLPVFFY